ncbi:3'-5' exonuclease [Deinococcus sp. YIM 134068]|uniref:3'-5' exonuclease n=1 Tax=Deinococcus lichenicola TaxID=3118910 RepID=UPI002F95E403
MEPFGRYLNVVDVEATCWEGPPPPGQVSEIIEVGLCVIDTFTLERVARHRLLVCPQRSEVSAFCTTLTGWTAEELEGGLSFRGACQLLQRDHHADLRAWASWGDYDRRQFERQCLAEDVPYPFRNRHTNVKAEYSRAHGLTRKLGMAEALAYARLPLEGRHHRGEDDAWNIGALVLSLMERGAWVE